MIAILTEKPSVAKDIAQALNIDTKGEKEGYFQGRGYMITYAFGHLVSLSLPEDYGKNRLEKKDLPFIPNPFTLNVRKTKSKKGMVPDRSAQKQLEIIRKVFSQCESIIAATDAGREGELIFRYIYSYLGCNKPVKRLWITSMTNQAIRNGFKNLRDGASYDNLYAAADCRAKADYLIGINASNALAHASGIVNTSLGRVQTPALAMICKRFNEHRKFVTSYFYDHFISLEKNGVIQKFQKTESTLDKQEAEKIYDTLKEYKAARITEIETENRVQQSPLLYDLTSLQKDANNRYQFSAEKTLEITQKLYENKLVSYPRTGSRYIPEDVFETIPKILRFSANFSGLSEKLQTMDFENLNRHSVDDSKITDHHAIIPTGVCPGHLSKEEKTIYEMISGRMMEAFAPACRKEFTRIQALLGEETFESKKSRILFAGWRSILNLSEDSEDDDIEENDACIQFSEGEKISVSAHSLVKRKTLPKPLYTEASLLSAMENAGRNLENEDRREALKDCGLGTPATRAAIIEVLLSRSYIERIGRNLVPTERGIVVYNCVKQMQIADVEMTGNWEKSLLDISRGEYNPQTFLKDIEIHTRQVTEEILSIDFKSEAGTGKIICPKCGHGNILIYNKIAKCSNQDCNLFVFRNILNKTLTEAQLKLIFTNKRTPLIKGFKNRDDKTFNASVVLTDDFSLKLDYSNTSEKKRKSFK